LKYFRSFLFLFTAMLSAGYLTAADTASITGIVSDSSGAVVPTGVVKLYSRSNTVAQTAQVGADGKFSFPFLTPAEYLLEASASKLALREPLEVTLTAGEAKQLKLELSIVTVSAAITVTASNSPQSIDQTSKALDVVDVDAAEQRGVNYVEDAIRLVPGLRISTRGGPGAFTTIQTRGARASDTAVLVDGFRLRDATGVAGDASAFIGDLLLVDSSRIEVLRGSGSSIYGTNSTAGTVNIITDSGGGGTHGDIDAEGGGLGLFRGAARLAGRLLNDKLVYSAGLVNLNVTEGVYGGGSTRNWSGQGMLAYSITPKMRVSFRTFDNTGYLQIQSIPYPAATVVTPASGIIPAIAPSQAALRLANDGLPFDAGNATFIPSLVDPDSRLNSYFGTQLFRWEYQSTSRLSWHVDYQFLNSSRDNLDGPGGTGYQPAFNTADDYNGRVSTMQARVDYLAGHAQAITAGYEYEHENFSNISSDQNPDPTQRVNAGTTDSQQYNAFFVQDQIRLFDDRLQILLSGRYQTVSLNTPQFTGGDSPYAGINIPSPPHALTGDASVSYYLRSSSTKFRAHAGNSFRMPSLYERFGTYFYGGFFTALGDPRLSPERSFSIDGGLDQYLFKQRLRVSATYFYTQFQERIGFDDGTLITPSTDPYGRYGGYFNTGGGLARGVELSGEFRPARQTTLFASYTYTNALDRVSEFSTGTPTNPVQVPGIIPNAFTVLATQQFGKRVDATLEFSGGDSYLFPIYGLAYRFGGPHTLNVSAGYTQPVSEHMNLRFYVRVANVLDQIYYEDGFTTPRSWAVGGIRLSF
jgi:vitamin B12 transporter